MKKLALFALLLVSFTGMAQLKKPAKWTITPSKQNPKVGEVITLTFKAAIDEGWYMYSSKLSVEGPMPTEMTVTPSPAFQLVGPFQAVNPKEKHDEVWGGKVQYFVKTGTFVQKVKVLKDKPVIDGKLSFQTCTIKDGSCVPNKEKFSVTL